MNNMKQTVNERIKLLRIATKLNQVDFANLIGISSSLQSKIEAEDMTPSVKVIDQIVLALSVPEDWLLYGKGQMTFTRKLKEDTPWKDEAWAEIKSKLNHYEDEIKFYRGLLQQNFLKVVKKAG